MNKGCIAFIVEGREREPEIIENISTIFFTGKAIKYITLPAEQNIYMLWEKMKEDDFDTDLIEVLRESSDDIRKQLFGITRDDFSEIFLFFDYDAHQNNLSRSGNMENDANKVIEQMLESFNNETESGKLYISYPMAEALRDFKIGMCGNGENCFVRVSECGNYKRISAEQSANPQINTYDFVTWKEIFEAFAKKISFFFGKKEIFTYEKYATTVSPITIQKLEEKQFQEGKVFVISAFPSFIADYFGARLWNSFLRNTGNHLEKTNCKRK